MKKSFIHETAVYYLFTLGGSLFIFGKCGVYCLLFACVLGVLSCFAAFYLKEKNIKIPVFLVSFAYGGYTFINFALFIKKKQLFHTPVIFIAIIFAAVIFYYCLANKPRIFKLSLVFFVCCVLFWTVLFLTTVKNADFTDIKYALSFDLKESLKVYFALFFPIIIPAVYLNGDIKPALTGSVFAAGTLLCFVILTYCTFGKINTHLDSPILSLVDTANVGRVFTRLDAFLLAVIYLSCLTRCGISFKTAFSVISRRKKLSDS